MALASFKILSLISILKLSLAGSVKQLFSLNNTDYSGGMIVTDWYGNSSEQIKISVQFLSNELSSTSIKVIAHKKKCKENNCFTEPANDSFNIEIKDKILNEARAIKINDDKTKK